MDSFLTYTPLISVAIVSGLFIMALVNFSTLKEKYAVAKRVADKKFENPKRAADIF
jgi:hypothetical protein